MVNVFLLGGPMVQYITARNAANIMIPQEFRLVCVVGGGSVFYLRMLFSRHEGDKGH